MSARQVALLLALIAGLVGAVVVPALQARAAASSELRIKAPRAVAAGRPITIEVSIRNAPTLGAFEATLAYDPAKAHLSGLERVPELVKQRRGIGILGPLEHAAGASFGFYSCVGTTCDTRIRMNSADAPATVTVARLVVTPDARGLLEFRLVSKAVDRAGGSLAVAGLDRRFVVRVGGGTRGLAAPAAPTLAATRAATAPRSRDLTRDDLTSNADAIEVALAWQTARERGGRCRVDADVAADIIADGCLDVADIQAVTGDYSGPKSLPRGLRGSPSTGPNGLPSATWTVTSTSDSSDTNIGNGVCATSGGVCTLRAAIQEANAHAGPDRIEFLIPGAGAQTITLGSTLPTLSDETGPTTIDGYTQPGSAVNTSPLAFNALIGIEVRGPSDGETRFTGMVISSANNTVRGLSIYRLPRHIQMTGAGSHHNNIVGNLIGTNAAATYLAPRRVERVGGSHLDSSAHHNYTGRPAIEDRNIVSGTASEGIYLTGAVDNYFYNNIVGLHPSGTSRLTNRIHGIDHNFGASRNIVGGLGPLERNVVSGNLRSGVEVSHGENTVSNEIIGNFIGTDLTGEASFTWSRNDSRGIHINDGPRFNLAMGNVVGGNREGGISVRGYLTTDNRVIGNYSGVTLSGLPIPNVMAGIFVSYHAVRTTIGPGNVVAFNPTGILIDAADTYGNRVTRNSVYANTSYGIELAPPGPNLNDANDADTGPNTRLNYPVIALVTPSLIRGTACASCVVEAFIADPLPTDLGGGAYGQPRTYVGSTTAGADGWFTLVPTGLSVGDPITSTATDAANNSSEASPNMPATEAPPAGTYAADTFSRSLSNQWGSADFGGSYSLAGTAGDFDVDGSRGTMALGAANANRAATLFAVKERDVDLAVRVQPLTRGDNAHIYLVGRRSTTSVTEYRARLRLAPNGTVHLAASWVLTGTETRIGSEVVVPGLTHGAGQDLWIRTQIAGEEPTRIRIRAWADGQPEPSGWTLVVTDSTAALQVSGAVGVRGYLGTGATTQPVTLGFDDLAVASAPLPPGTPPVAQDAFGRTVANGWGTADIGGAYTVGGGPASDFSVDGSTGRMVIATAGSSRAANLMSVSQLDGTSSVSFAADATVQGAHIYLVQRRSIGGGTTTEYRARVRVSTTGTLFLLLSRVVASSETVISSEIQVPGTQAAGQTVRFRFNVTGTNPTTLRARVWNDGSAEPSGWQAVATDSATQLQAAGAVGIRAYLGSSSASAPATMRFDDLLMVPSAP